MKLSRLMVATLLSPRPSRTRPGGLLGAGGPGRQAQGPRAPRAARGLGQGRRGRGAGAEGVGAGAGARDGAARAPGDTEPGVPPSSRRPGRHKSEITGDIVSVQQVLLK